ncbi:MAG: restriction endonuclease subunit S [Treponema sp.]|nr:restriction endonuclease subunit S [Candidatus Treponema scatequi]
MAKMKNSGVEWIGEIPEGWEVCKLKYCLLDKMQYGANSSGITFQPELPRYIRITDIKNNYELFSEEKLSLPENETAEFLLENGDLLFARSGATVGKTFLYRKAIGKAGFAGYLIKAKCNTEKLIPDFLCYFTQCSSYDSWKNQIFIQATIQNIGADKYSNMEIPCPSIQLQQKIATYLDEKCSQIEQTIQNQQQVIEKLKAYKQSLITEAVTGKVKIQNGKVAGKYEQYKDSGVEWIGEIPSGWEVKKLKYIADSFSKGSGITKDEIVINGDTPCIRYGELYAKYDYHFSKCETRTNLEIIETPKYFSHGDVLFTCTGELVEEIGKSIAYLGNEKCLAGGDIIVLKHSQDPMFMGYALDSKYVQGQKSFGKTKLKVVHISSGEIAGLLIALPPKEEQKSIAEYLDKTCTSIDSAIEQKQKLIEKLTEYKKSLIYECVTGKKEI